MAEEKTIAFVLYPGLTVLDLVGPLQVLTDVPGYRTVVVAERLDTWETDTSLRVTASHTFAEVPDPSVVIVPGGGAPTLRALADETLIGYLRDVGGRAEVVGSVCTGSLVLGAADLLKGRQATTHWSMLDRLTAFDATPVRKRWVEDGPVITAAGVSAGIDMALHLLTRLAGADYARLAQYILEYDPEPPLGRLDWTKAPHDFFAPFVEQWLQEALGDHPDLHTRLAGPR
ncbi:DJ-1/PfpI family protein [Amycolatopsis anabasis]|uniref:DJ-1/PfpI family protein n=1 Tax=Amycolatopsis anabasis TaxID=1840409 RepID=UPI00131BE308|nr:DJ-1/PfpI family protein [Amycolatopsis anabasis]